jgi:arsenate reductase-like glutaredoxin family protein
MRVSKNQILLIYNSSDIQDREALAYARSVSDKELKTIDVQYNPLTQSQLKSIASKLNIEPELLVDKESSKYLKYYFNTDLSPKEILKTLKHNPSMINTPIVVFNKGAEFVDESFDFSRKAKLTNGSNAF